MVGGFKDAGFYVETLLDEQGFLKWITQDGPAKLRAIRPELYVYNLAQQGTGPARLSLVPSLCNLQGLNLLDSDAYGVAVARHKFHAVSIARAHGLPGAESWWYDRAGWWPSRPPEGKVVFAKPTFESASIGVTRESHLVVRAGIEEKLARMRERYRQSITVQEFVSGYEVEVPIFVDQEPHALMAVGIARGESRRLGDDVLTFDDVYSDSYSFYPFESEDAEAAAKVCRVAEDAVRGLGLRGVARVDFRVTDDGTPVIIELACKPHLVPHSSFWHALRAHNAGPVELCRFLVGAAVGQSRQILVRGPELDVAE